MPIVDPPWLHNLNPWLTLIGFVITFLGFVITVYVLIEVKRIKSDFLVRARLPGVIKDLEKAGTALNSTFAEWPSRRHEAHGQVKVAATLLKTALNMLSPLERKELERVQAKLVEAASNLSNSKYREFGTVYDLYSDIQSGLVSLTQISKNKKWE